MYIIDRDIQAWRLAMRVAKWGNSLAVRLPQSVVDDLGLREGDDVVLARTGENELSIAKAHDRKAALERLKSICLPLPDGYKFDREEANSRP